MNDITLLSTILPIFAVIALGYLAVRWRLFAWEAIPHMGQFVIRFCLPALVFSAVAGSPVHEIVHLGYMVTYTLGSVLSLLTGLLVMMWVCGRSVTEGALTGAGQSVSNSAFIGAPVLIAIYGDLPVNAFAMNVIVENVVVIPLVLIMLETGRHTAGAAPSWLLAGKVARSLSRNPILLSLVAGLLANLAGLRIPVPVEQSLDFLVNAAAGVSLFVIGGSLVGAPLRGNVRSILGIASGKLLLHPFLVALMIWALPDFDSELQRIAILSAAMPMLGIYPALAGQYRDPSLYAAALTVTTLAALLTLSVWLSVLY